MADLLLKNHAPDAQGLVHRVTPESAGWGHVGFELYRLQARPEPGGVDRRARGMPGAGRRQGAGARRRARLRRDRRAHGAVRGQEAGRGLRALAQRLSGRGDHRARARRLLGAGRRRPRRPPDRPGSGRLLGARRGQQHAPRLRHPARDRAGPFAARGRGDHARGRLVILPEPQARHRQSAARVRAAGDLLPPAQPAAGLCLPAHLYRRPLARRDAWPSRTATSCSCPEATIPAAPRTATSCTT